VWASDITALNANINAAAPPEWDCNNAGGNVAPLDSPIGGHMSCRTAPPLGALLGQSSRFPHVLAAKYPSH